VSRARPVAIALLAGVLAAGCAAEDPAVAVGGELVSWEGTLLADGRPVRFAAGDGATVLNVWATWCEPCRREMASLEVAHRRLGAQGIRVVGVNIDRDVLLAREHARRMGLSFTNLSDPEQKLARDRLGVRRLPTTLGIGTDGRLRWRDEAARDWAEADRLAWVARTLSGGVR
jgi:thiol-disulfide isomerase/thioredoxin